MTIYGAPKVINLIFDKCYRHLDVNFSRETRTLSTIFPIGRFRALRITIQISINALKLVGIFDENRVSSV